jgi:hypothetical protein
VIHRTGTPAVKAGDVLYAVRTQRLHRFVVVRTTDDPYVVEAKDCYKRIVPIRLDTHYLDPIAAFRRYLKVMRESLRRTDSARVMRDRERLQAARRWALMRIRQLRAEATSRAGPGTISKPGDSPC